MREFVTHHSMHEWGMQGHASSGPCMVGISGPPSVCADLASTHTDAKQGLKLYGARSAPRGCAERKATLLSCGHDVRYNIALYGRTRPRESPAGVCAAYTHCEAA